MSDQFVADERESEFESWLEVLKRKNADRKSS